MFNGKWWTVDELKTLIQNISGAVAAMTNSK